MVEDNLTGMPATGENRTKNVVEDKLTGMGAICENIHINPNVQKSIRVVHIV